MNPFEYNNFYPPYDPHFFHHGPHMFHPHFPYWFPHFGSHGFPHHWPHYFPPYIPYNNNYNNQIKENKHKKEYHPNYEDYDFYEDLNNKDNHKEEINNEINNDSKNSDINPELKNNDNNNEDFNLLHDSENISISFQSNSCPKNNNKESDNNEENTPEIITISYHEHPLNYINNLNLICTICQQINKNNPGYKCEKCPFIICLSCAERIFYGNKKTTIHHHPLLLIYENEFKCNICEIEFKNTSFFYCDKCKFNVCTFCFIS